MNKKIFIILSVTVILIVASVIIVYFLNIAFNKNSIATENAEKINEIANNSNTINENKDVIMNLSSSLDYAIDLSDKNVRNKNSEYIIIGNVSSIEGTTNYNLKEKVYTSIGTYGNIKVQKVLKGNIDKEIIPFIRLGGVISFFEYEKGLTESQKSKIDFVSKLNEDEKKSKYVSYIPENDISIEKGKTYLMYLKYNSDYEKYIIQFMEYGLREVQIENNIDKISVEQEKKIKIKNNKTGEFEILSDVVDF